MSKARRPGNIDSFKQQAQNMELNTLKDLYIHELKDLYSAEKQIIAALPKMVKAASNEQLAAGFKDHLEQTKEHAVRLEKILSSHSQTTRGPKCKGMEGVLQEGAEMIEEEADDEVQMPDSLPPPNGSNTTKWRVMGALEPMPNCWVIRKGRNYFRRHLPKSPIRTKGSPSSQLL